MPFVDIFWYNWSCFPKVGRGVLHSSAVWVKFKVLHEANVFCMFWKIGFNNVLKLAKCMSLSCAVSLAIFTFTIQAASLLLGCQGPGQAAPRNSIMVYYFELKSLEKQQEWKEFSDSFVFLKAGNKSPCDRCPLCSWETILSQGLKNPEFKSLYKQTL